MPHMYSTGSPEEVKEERRLAYVAVTRAKQHLILSHARSRNLFGEAG